MWSGIKLVIYMYEYDIVYIKGNPKSGTSEQHENINKTIINLIREYQYKIIESDMRNKECLAVIPKAKVYIGFSRGSRYLNKLSKNVLKISIGGVSGAGIYQFVNVRDKILEGDISQESLSAHFNILQEEQESIKKLIDESLYAI